MQQNNFHKNFQLNGHSFSSVDEILNYAYKFSEELYVFLKEWFSKANFINVHTSGSTGKPKSIQLKKEFVKNAALATGNYFDLQENTSALLCLPIAYIAGKMMLIRALILGWQLDMIPPTSFPFKNIKKHYDFSAMIPLQLEKSISKISLIKKLIVGGSFVSKKLEDKIQNISTKIFATYGMTETITHIAVKKLNNKSVSPTFYEVLPNITLYKDERNCLVIKAPKITDEIIFTNDVIRLISDKQFEWLGRFDNVINSGGIKLHPERIEEKLTEIIKERFFVAGVSDAVLGEKLVLVIELNTLKSKKLISLVEERVNNLASLSKFEIPKEIYFIPNFIETATKKIQRKKTLDLVGFNHIKHD